MLFFPGLLQLLAASLCIIQFAAAKSRAGHVTLINATPYDWHLTYNHSFQILWDFPQVIKAGTSHEQYVKFVKDQHDDGAEAFYTLVNSPLPASFIVKARAPKHIEVRFQETLFSLNNPQNASINLGFIENGAVSFILSGEIDSYISSNPPVTWMQATLPTIGAKTLRQISMPASHDSGMSEVSNSWFGDPHNTQTQTANVYHQLMNGARVFDIRPTYFKRQFYTGHFSAMGKGAVGGTGRKIRDIVNDINAFNDKYPGELIILDISHEMDATKRFRTLSDAKWAMFYEVIDKIHALWVPTSDVGEDFSSLPLSAFITPGSKSAVLVRLPDYAPLSGAEVKRRTVGTFDGVAMTNLTDGMMPMGPALQGDDDDNIAAIATVVESIPSVLPPSGRTDNNANVSSDAPSSDADVLPDPAPRSPSRQSIPSHPAYIPASLLPISGSYSNTESPDWLSTDQLSKLTQLRSSPDSEIHKSVWTITQQGLIHLTDVANKKTSVVGLAKGAKRVLLANIWGKIVDERKWPNEIETDDVADTQVVTLCMAINRSFLGDWKSENREVAMVKRRRG